MGSATKQFDIAFIGGGASGLAGAICAARTGASVAVIEQDVEAGLSILATGNGRCNLSNKHLDPARYRDAEWARAVMGAEPERALRSFFDSLGIVTVSIDGRLYPYSRRAESVRDALLGACDRAGAAILCCRDLVGAARLTESSMWQLDLVRPRRMPRSRARDDFKTGLRTRRKELKAAPREDERVLCRAAVIACGGSSEALAETFSLPHAGERPVLCPVACELEGDPAALASLDGLRIEARLVLERAGAPLWDETGEVLFRPYGISGIVAFDLSRRVQAGDTVIVDPFPTFDASELDALFDARSRALGTRPEDGPAFFDGLLARPLAELLARTGTRRLRLRAKGTCEERSAQVRRGGLPRDAFDPATLAIRPPAPAGLFACGEALDQDADCGGFNLAWAWLSGSVAGQAASAYARG